MPFLLHLRYKRTAEEKPSKNEARKWCGHTEDEEANEEEESVNHQSLSSADLVVEKACNGCKEEVGENPNKQTNKQTNKQLNI